ncbi:MAG: TIGR02217 family protein [Sphingobium sp.]|nr:TIGR02217 family protein [Sphingobium sp.]
MAYWLASASLNQDSHVRETNFIKRFSPVYWTVNFPRPMMASVITTAPDALRVDAVFYGSGDLAGLIWDAQDNWTHPLLAYETSRDFRHSTLRFRWRSDGIRALDAVNGPTLTIEGRDAAGQPRNWYIRLWNYAAGSPEDAIITLDFDALVGGFTWPDEADPVWAGDVDRMFLSIIPTDYDRGDTPFDEAQTGWVELSDMECTGSGSVLAIGDAMVPENGLSMATGYDDGYNQTPERLLRQIHALGYRGDILHYVGMSHYFRLRREGGDYPVTLAGGALNEPCIRWHRDFAQRALELGFGVIWSLSYELLNAHCPEGWKQRAHDGAPALTGWDPPSALLSPANEMAMAYLQAVGRAFIAIGRDAGLDPKFQVGEPWWWVIPQDGRICLYDDAARVVLGAVLGNEPPIISDVGGEMTSAQLALLDAAGEILAASTARLCDAVRDEAPDTITHLLSYLPTVLDPAAPEAKRANLPIGWAKPAFDVLQLEDYDWVTEGRTALTAKGIDAATARLGYPLAEQHYLSGFVLRAEDAAAHWPRIEGAARASEARGSAVTFIWALPQVARDGFTTFGQTQEDDMKAFDDVLFPLSIGREAGIAPAFSTQVVESLSGHERRSSDWADARMSFDAGPGVRSEADMVTLVDFFRARRGAARGFRFTDPYDHQSAPLGEVVSAIDQRLGIGDGVNSRFQIIKYYGAGQGDGEAQQRYITRPVAGSIRVAVNGVEQMAGWTHAGLGVIMFDEAPVAGAILTCGYHFDVPVRFAEDRLEINRATFAAGSAPSVPLVELRA